MRHRFATLLLCSLLASCSAAPSDDAADDAADDALPEVATIATFPATLEGQVVFDVIEGDSEFGEYGDANFGDLQVDGKIYLLYAPGPVAQAGGLPLEGGRARVTLAGASPEFDGFHVVSRIEKL